MCLKSINHSIPDLLLETMNMVPHNQGVILMMRHSVRFSVEDVNDESMVTLTPDGIRLAEELGALLPWSLGKIVSSPVNRCLETGNALARGAKVTSQSTPDKMLGATLLYSDNKLGNSTFNKLKTVAVVDGILSGKPLPGIHDATKICCILLNRFFETPPNLGKINTFITHNGILAPFVYYLLGEKGYDFDKCPSFLEGVFLWGNRDQTYFAWRGKVHEVPKVLRI